MVKVLIVHADNGQDPTEAAVPYQILKAAGFQVDFATEQGTPGACDPKMLAGPLFGQLGASKPALQAYREMSASPDFLNPHSWSSNDFSFDEYDCVLLPGGHDKPMRQYLESTTLRRQLSTYFPQTSKEATIPKPKVVAAICHGVLALARTMQPSPNQDKSVLYDAETTTLPVHLERMAYLVSAWKLGSYYRTYDTYCADEVKSLLRSADLFQAGPWNLTTSVDRKDAFVVEATKYHYLSARWPGDAEVFGERVRDRLLQLHSI